MTVVGLSAGSTKLVLWISKILYEKAKTVPATYMLFPEYETPSSNNEIEKMKRTVCSYCHRILVSKKEILEKVENVLKPSHIFEAPDLLLDKESGFPIIGLRGKLGHHLFSKPSAASTFGKPNLAQNVLSPEHVWLTPDQYYTSFDRNSDNILINYGICEICYYEIMAAFFPTNWSSGMKPGTAESSEGVLSATLND